MQTFKKISWFKNINSKPKAKIRLFCFHHAGGGASVFKPWLRHFPQEIEICPVLLPGRETRIKETPYISMERLLNRLAYEIEPFLDKPCAFFGHSMGSTISYELTRCLLKWEKPTPVKLFLSGRRAPHMPSPKPKISELPHDEFLEELREQNGTPEEVFESEELLEFVIPILRTDYRLLEHHEHIPGPPIDIPITAFGGSDDRDVPIETIRGWEKYTSSHFDFEIFPGGHFYIKSPQSKLVPRIGRDLLNLINKSKSTNDPQLLIRTLT